MTNLTPEDSKLCSEPQIPNLSFTSFVRAIDQLVQGDKKGANDQSQTVSISALRDRVKLEPILSALISSTPRDEVRRILDIAMGLTPGQDVPLQLRKDLTRIFIEAAKICAKRGLIEPQVRLGRTLHAFSVLSPDPQLKRLIQAHLLKADILFDYSLQQYSPLEFEAKIKYQPGNHDFHGYTSFSCALEFVDCFVSVGCPEESIIETCAIFKANCMKHPQNITGYEMLITSANGRTKRFPISTADRASVKKLHNEVVRLVRSGHEAKLNLALLKRTLQRNAG